MRKSHYPQQVVMDGTGQERPYVGHIWAMAGYVDLR